MDKQKLDELRPCPFCRSKAIRLMNNKAKCSNFRCALSNDKGINIEEWQSRPIEDELIKEIQNVRNQWANY